MRLRKKKRQIRRENLRILLSLMGVRQLKSRRKKLRRQRRRRRQKPKLNQLPSLRLNQKRRLVKKPF